MTDGALVAALCARSPGALADLYDSYAESVYRYCRSMLATSGAAESALLDTLVAAEAHIHALTDARRLEAWLYALARGECVRRDLDEGHGSQDPAPVVAAGDDADLRVMAWNATRSLSPDDREILDLSCRHGFGPIDLAAVLGVTPKVAGALYESARERLRDVVTAEVLVRKGPYDCASRARMLTGFGGELTPEARERVIRHVNRCDTCAPHRVRQVSAAKVYDLLPLVALPPTLRAWVMSHFTDPERVPYRRDVADRAGPLDGAGFPVDRVRGSRRRPYVLAGAAAVAAMTALALVLVQTGIGPQGTGSGVASDAFPAVLEPSDSWRPGESRREGAPVTSEPVGEGAAVERIGSLGVTEPVSATGPELRSDRRPGAPDPTGHRGESGSRQPGDEPPGEGPPGPVDDGSSGEGASDDGSPDDGAVDRPAAPAENPALPSPPLSPVPPGSPGIGTPDRHHPSRDHHGHSPRRCRTPHRPANPANPANPAPPWTAPGSPQEDSAPPRANPRSPGDVTGPRGGRRPPRAAPTPRRTDPRPPRAEPGPPRADLRPPFTHPRRSPANPDRPTSGQGRIPDDSRPASTGPGRSLEGPERISTSADRERTDVRRENRRAFVVQGAGREDSGAGTPDGGDSVAGDDYGE
ncbi:sigma-70 family RNA polymerase sigma factor [Streptosporangium sp. NPDC006930]|uniref:sigma-70 family RNA polymerase sigma factor n=1 Tax=Streptosporangium sp. NPDC006930 TaxID=3154783 RepID=UPI003441612E